MDGICQILMFWLPNNRIKNLQESIFIHDTPPILQQSWVYKMSTKFKNNQPEITAFMSDTKYDSYNSVQFLKNSDCKNDKILKLLSLQLLHTQHV